MTLQDTRTSHRTFAIPRPREERADEDIAVEEKTAPEQTAVEPNSPGEKTTGGEFPWPEPWHFSRGARPRSEYWDAATARWHSRGPVVHEHER